MMLRFYVYFYVYSGFLYPVQVILYVEVAHFWMNENDVYVIKRKNTDNRVLYDAEYTLEETLYYFQRSQERSAEQIR